MRLLSAWSGRRRGVTAVMAAFLMVIVFAFVAFAVDVGFLALTRTRMQNAADAAALSAALELDPLANPADVRAAARLAAQNTAESNLGTEATYFNSSTDLEFGRLTYDPVTKQSNIAWGDSHTPHNVVRVVARRHERAVDDTQSVDERLPLFFAPILGIPKATINTTSVASFQARDIMVVLDFSASMNDDSTLAALNTWGRAAVEANLKQIWQELGAPAYGTLQFTPAYAVFSGQPASGNKPHIDVTWKGTQIDVVSTKDIKSVRLEFSNGSTDTISGDGKSGTFKGSGGNGSRTITRAWVRSGSNGNPGEEFEFSTSDIKKALGLSNVAYPYPAGSWDEYISYCNSSDDQPADAGYRWKYGYLTWMNYLLEKRPAASETPDLWKTTCYPAEALKSGVDVFGDYLMENAAEDRVGLSVYSSSNGAVLEYGLSNDLQKLKTTARQRQPGHYDPYTNIGAGMQLARQELVANSRPKASRLMVVMTDGLANKPVSTGYAKNFVRQEAELAKASNIKVMTISLGFEADPTLMQEVADITGGLHYNVPGGSSAEEYVEGMRQAFLKIGASRPLRLID